MSNKIKMRGKTAAMLKKWGQNVNMSVYEYYLPA